MPEQARTCNKTETTYNAEKGKIAALEKQLEQLGINPAAVANGNIVSIMALKTGSVEQSAPIDAVVRLDGKDYIFLVDEATEKTEAFRTGNIVVRVT